MNKLFSNVKYVALAMIAFAAQACQSVDDKGVVEPSTRTITVATAATRTTISYEGSDVSHLVWENGDEVAYVTDAAGDTFKTAEVIGNEFTAEIPSGAQNIYVLYPVGNNEGKSLAEASVTIESNIIQVAEESFNGELLPMMAQAAVPYGNRVDVVYECMASVLRFSVKGDKDRESEFLKSLKVSAAESLAGEFTLDLASKSMVFHGDSNEINVTYESTGAEALLVDTPEVYVVVPSAVYSDVDVIVTTDVDSYYWLDGQMDLTHPERRLFRVALDLANSEEAPQPEVAYFKPVMSAADITDDGTYLIATYHDGKFLVTNNVPTDQSNYYYVTGVEVNFDENGIIADELSALYTWQITKKEGGYEIFSPNMVKQGNTGVLLISQGGSGSSLSQSHGEGKAWFVTPETADGYAEAQQPRRYWDIVPDGTGITVLYNKYDRQDGNGRVCYKYSTANNYFTLCYENADMKEEIRLFKLQ